MKRLVLAFFALLLVFSMVACAASQPTTEVEEATTEEVEETSGDDVEVPDFSQNVNVNRASDFAKNELELPVDGIGTGITTDVEAEGDYTIVVMTKNSTNPYMNGMWKGGQKAGEDMSVNVVTLAPAQQDSIEEQLAIMEAQIQQGVDAFVIHPSDSNGIMPSVNAANEAGILAALEEYPDFYLIDSQTANFNRAQGMQVMENLLQREGVKDELALVIAANDEMALGAIQALKAAGVSDVLVGGFDGSKDASQAIKDGDLTVTYNTDPFGSTYLAVAYLVEFLNDGSVPAEYFIPFPSERHDPLITADNIDEYIENFAWFK